jgi:hypothetical protein
MQTHSRPVKLEQIVERIFMFRQITRFDQSLLQSALYSRTSLSRHQHLLLQKMFDALQQGEIWIEV